jgi:hypothetical protein
MIDTGASAQGTEYYGEEKVTMRKCEAFYYIQQERSTAGARSILWFTHTLDQNIDDVSAVFTQL